MHRTRVITSIIGATLIIALIGWGSFALFWLLISSATVIGLLEFYNLAKGGNLPTYRLPGMLAGWLLSLAPFAATGVRTGAMLPFTTALILFAVTLIVLAMFSYSLLTKQPAQEAMTALAVTLFGIFYVAWLFMHLTLLRDLSHGREFVFYLLLLVWMGDTGAYYVGKSFGKHPLSPVISPKKTVEGAVGGLVATLLASIVAAFTFLPHIRLIHAIILGVLLAVVAQIGDLCESLLKRSVNVKDSGTLLPGHGGILDRVDGLIFAAPVLDYYALVFLIA